MKKAPGCYLAAGLMVLAATSASMADTIAQVRAAAANSTVNVTNVVISSLTDLINSTNSKSFQIQDDTGALTVYGTNANVDALLTGLVEGDRISFTAVRGADFNGLVQLIAPFSNVTKVDSPGVPAPTPVVATDFADASTTAEALESKVVKLSNVRFTTSGNFAYNVNYYANADGVATTNPKVNVRVQTTTLDLVNQPIPQGFVNITGVFSQYDSSSPYDGYYQLLVRSMSDIEQLSPSGVPATNIIVKNAPKYTITLQGTPIDGGTLSYRIKQNAVRMLPEGTADLGGTLYLPGTSTQVTLNADLPGNQVDFQPAAGVSGWFQFKFAVFQTSFAESTPVTVDIFIQDPGKVVISEIMYAPIGYQFDWEYVELTNVGGTDVALDTLFDSRLRLSTGVEKNLFNAEDFGASPVVEGSIIPAGQKKVVMETNAYRSTEQFLNAWNPGAGDVTYPATGGDANKVQRQNLMVVNYAAGSGATAQLDDTGDTLFLFDQAGNCLDVVKFENGTNGWPASNASGSIYLESNKMNVVDNDNGANWRLSVTGVAASKAYASTETFGPPRESNVGSPALLPTGTTAQVTAPTATDQVIDTVFNQGAANFTSIALAATDPNNLPLTYRVMSQVQGLAPTTGIGGSLKDGSTLADITVGATLGGNTVLFKPSATASGRYAFTFVANNGVADSAIAYVTLFVQDHNRVVISEIMWNPYNQADAEWEWVEVSNLTSSDIALHSLLDEGAKTQTAVTTDSYAGNLVGVTIPANSTRVLARQVLAPISPWLTEWSKPAAATTTFIADNRWPALNNSTATGKTFCDRVFLYAADGSLLDVVAFDDAAPWPVDSTNPKVYAGHSSIYFTPAALDTFENDNGTSWAFSVPGTDQAYATTNGADFGSPGILAHALSLVFDFNGDGAVDIVNDRPVFLACGSGPAVAHNQSANCQQADYDDDNDVDTADFGLFQRCLQTSEMTPLPECMQ